MWESRRLTDLWASRACYRNSFTFTYNSQIKYFRSHVDMDIFLVLVRGTRAQNLSASFSKTYGFGTYYDCIAVRGRFEMFHAPERE
jgi:hypothetical protein